MKQNQDHQAWPPAARRPPLRLLALLGLLAATVADCAAVAPPAADARPAEPASSQTSAAAARPFDLKDPARIDAGRRRFNKTCAGYCHGFEGVGGRAPDFKGRTDLSADEEFRTISNGRQGADVMPPWGAAFSEEQIWELVAYLQHLGPHQADR